MDQLKTLLTKVDYTKLAKFLAPYVSKLINDETAVGKAGKAAKWSVLSLILVAVLTAIVANPAVFTAAGWGSLVVVANVLLVLLNNLKDPETKNF